MDIKAPRAPSIVASFCRWPELPYAGDNVALDGCPLVRAAARAPHAVLGEGATSVVIGSPPLQMGQQVRGLLGCGPGATCQGSYSMTDGQVHPLDTSRIQPSREAHRLQGTGEIFRCPQPHHLRHPNQLTPPVTFLHLPVDEPRCYLPPTHVLTSPTDLYPLSKMGGQCIEIQIEPVTGEDGDAARCQHLPQAVNERMRRPLRAGSHMQDWK